MSEQQNGQRKSNNRSQNNNRNRNNNRHRNNNRNQRQYKPKPLELSTWQKILIFFKLTSEDKIRKQLQANRPARNKSGSSISKDDTNKPARKNTHTNKERQAPQKITVETPRLYVGNLSYDATEYDIEDLFKGIGSVKNVEIIYNRHTHKSKGYGFVQMLNIDEAKRAVDVLHDQPFLGRNLIVNGSKARKASDPNSSNYNTDEANPEESSKEPAA